MGLGESIVYNDDEEDDDATSGVNGMTEPCIMCVYIYRVCSLFFSSLLFYFLPMGPF